MLMRREMELWVKAAEEDLEDAEIALSRGRWFRAAFFSQQAVGKVLKALFFVVRREEPPRLYVVAEPYPLLKEAGFSLPVNI